ncbi:MAG: endo alpha-1,4 polygalactosaminidase [Magnetovibrionaceae bacterium]
MPGSAKWVGPFWAFLAVFLSATASMAIEIPKDKPWVVYYSDQAAVADFEAYGLVVLDRDTHPPLRPLIDRGKVLLGYLSLGEVENIRPHYQDLKAEGLLLRENKFWENSYFIDVRDLRWTVRVIEELIPQILRKGFHGIFVDTMDNPLYLEEVEPETYAGMTRASINLIKAIRRHYPNLLIMINRAYDILPALAHDIDAVLGESVRADYDFENEVYRRVPEELSRPQREKMKALLALNPDLRLMTLDYWDPDDPAPIRDLYARQREEGFEPYVSTLLLNRIIPEP